MLGGNMCCGVERIFLMLRLGNDNAEKALKEEAFTREMDFTGKPLRSMIYVEPEGFEHDDDLKYWVKKAALFTARLPVKEK